MEKDLHINVLESKAVLFGLQSLCKVNNQHILIRSDNTATVGAINKMGSSKSSFLDNTVVDIWNWALENNNWLTCSHIAGVLNEEADEESRKQELRTEWMLNREIFSCITQQLSFSPIIDLFASRLNAQLPRFASFRPDPEAEIINSFTLFWGDLDSYAFPSFILIAKVIQKIILDQATGILVVPDWANQSWYNLYQDIRINGILLPPRYNLFCLPSQPDSPHPMWEKLRLRAALVTGTGLCRQTHLQQ